MKQFAFSIEVIDREIWLYLSGRKNFFVLDLVKYETEKPSDIEIILLHSADNPEVFVTLEVIEFFGPTELGDVIGKAMVASVRVIDFDIDSDTATSLDHPEVHQRFIDNYNNLRAVSIGLGIHYTDGITPTQEPRVKITDYIYQVKNDQRDVRNEVLFSHIVRFSQMFPHYEYFDQVSEPIFKETPGVGKVMANLYGELKKRDFQD